jgi:hypothetical protein
MWPPGSNAGNGQPHYRVTLWQRIIRKMRHDKGICGKREEHRYVNVILGECTFRGLDTFNADAFASFLTEDAIFVFGNAEPVNGRTAIREVVAHFFQ